MNKSEILFLAHRFPYPPDKGDKIRSWRMLAHLVETYDVHLGCFVDDPADMVHAPFLKSMTTSLGVFRLNPSAARIRSLGGLCTGAPLTFLYYRDRRMLEYVKTVRAQRLAGEIAFSSSMAPYIAEPVDNRPRIVDLCDADSEKWRQYAESARGPMRLIYKREARVLAAAETAIINWADVALAISNDEARLFDSRPGVRRHVRRFANGVDTKYFSPSAQIAEANVAAEVVFVGVMDYRANIEAVQWFADAVWPRIRQARPEARFAIVGARPRPEVRRLARRAGIVVTGRVADVRPFLRQARAVVAPLRVARGVQNKVLEAMAMARPVVASPGANAGVGAIDGEEIVLADAAETFAQSVCRLIDDPQCGGLIGARARRRVEEDFAWAARLGELDAALEAAGLP